MQYLPKEIPPQNLLNEWYKRVNLQNSDFSIQRKIQVDGNKLIALKDYLNSFFGADHFNIDARILKIILIEAKNANWLFQLLANDDYPSLLQLFELEHLLKYTSANHPDLTKILQANSSNQAFRNYLFEAIVFEMLSSNKIKFEAKPNVNGKEREGFIWINNQQFLFECKKLYSYQLPGIGFIFTVHQEFFRLWLKRPISINGYISIYINNDLKLKASRQLFNQIFKEYFLQVKNKGKLTFDSEIVDDNRIAVGRVLFEQYDHAVFEHYTQLIKHTAVCFKILPPKTAIIEEKLKELRNTKILFKFHMLEHASIDFLLEKIDKKRKSQNDMKHLPRIFFFDNEVYRGSELPLFQSDLTFGSERIQAYLNSKTTNDIVCIFFRNYSNLRHPQWNLKVFCKPELDHMKQIIEQWLLLYQRKDFNETLPVSLMEQQF